MTTCFDVFAECVRAIDNNELIQAVSVKDKEFHFQNWFEQRLINLNLNYDEPGRNTYPDFRLVNNPEGYEIKGLAIPGRDKNTIVTVKFRLVYITDELFFMYLEGIPKIEAPKNIQL